MTILIWRDTQDPIWKYEVSEEYYHRREHRLETGMRESKQMQFYSVAFGVVDELWIHKGYRWNGSNVVLDTRWDMLASCVHDVDTQCMTAGLLAATWTNWRRAASEYRRNCVIEAKRLGLRRWKLAVVRSRAWSRYTGICSGWLISNPRKAGKERGE